MGKHRWPIAGDDVASLQPLGSASGRGPWHQEMNGDGQHATRGEPLATTAEAIAPGPQGWDAGIGDHPDQPSVRWRVARSAAVVFLGVALAIGTSLYLVRSSEPSAAAVSVHLDAERSHPPGSPSSESKAGSPSSESKAGSPSSESKAVSQADETPEAAAQSASTAAPRPAGVVVYVTGAVVAPGVVTVAEGTRLFEVIDASGGALPEADLESINLAGIPSDGQHIHLRVVGEEPRAGGDVQDAPPPPSGGSGGAPDASGTSDAPRGTGGAGGPSEPGVIDINSATLAEIESLPRVGPVLGQRILDWREDHGPFARAADIDAVPGIGPAILDGILPLIVAE